MAWTQFNDVQFHSGWLQPGNAGNGGGSDPTKPHGTYTTAVSGIYLDFHIYPAASYDNYFYYKVLSSYPASIPPFVLDETEIFIPTGNWAKSQGVEWQCQYSNGQYTFNMAWAMYKGGFYYFHYTGGSGQKWIRANDADTGLPIPLPSVIENTPLNFKCIFELRAGYTKHKQLIIN